MEINEQTIIRSCQNGQLEEFGQLYEKYVRKIYDFIYYKTHHKETAEDLTSLTFTKALEKISNYNSNKGSFSSWLYTIARHSVIDHYRSKKDNLDIDDIWDLSDKTDIPRDLDIKEKLQKVEKYLKGFKAEQRELFILRAWQGYSYTELAKILNKSEGSLKMNFSRILNKLKNEMPLSLFITLLLLN